MVHTHTNNTGTKHPKKYYLGTTLTKEQRKVQEFDKLMAQKDQLIQNLLKLQQEIIISDSLESDTIKRIQETKVVIEEQQPITQKQLKLMFKKMNINKNISEVAKMENKKKLFQLLENMGFVKYLKNVEKKGKSINTESSSEGNILYYGVII